MGPEVWVTGLSPPGWRAGGLAGWTRGRPAPPPPPRPAAGPPASRPRATPAPRSPLPADRQLHAEGVEELEPAMGVIRRSIAIAVAGMGGDRRAHRLLHPVVVVLGPPQVDLVRSPADEGDEVRVALQEVDVRRIFGEACG